MNNSSAHASTAHKTAMSLWWPHQQRVLCARWSDASCAIKTKLAIDLLFVIGAQSSRDFAIFGTIYDRFRHHRKANMLHMRWLSVKWKLSTRAQWASRDQQHPLNGKHTTVTTKNGQKKVVARAVNGKVLNYMASHRPLNCRRRRRCCSPIVQQKKAFAFSISAQFRHIHKIIVSTMQYDRQGTLTRTQHPTISHIARLRPTTAQQTTNNRQTVTRPIFIKQKFVIFVVIYSKMCQRCCQFLFFTIVHCVFIDG